MYSPNTGAAAFPRKETYMLRLDGTFAAVENFFTPFILDELCKEKNCEIIILFNNNNNKIIKIITTIKGSVPV